MRIVVALGAVALAACADPVDPRWQLDHDHVVAVRATPPRILPAERAAIDALVAHEGGPSTIETPAEVAAPRAPEGLQDLVYRDGGTWFVTAPLESTLATVRAATGLAADAPVPLDLYMAFARPDGDPLYAKKTVWLGASAENPVAPEAQIDGGPMADSLVVPKSTDVYLSVAVDPSWRVSWLSSCGTLFQDDVATSFLRVLPEDRAEGELAVVVRDPDGGVAWRVWPISAATP